MTTLISIVVPTHNEASNVGVLCSRLARVFETLPAYNWEIIFVDDSLDATPKVIAELAEDNPRIKLIRLVRSFGQSIAIAAGLNRARGDAAILMDADLQDPPEVIPQLIERWRAGNKVVYVQRASQSSSRLYRFLAPIFYRILTKISDVPIPVDAGEFRLLDRVVVDYMNGLNERSRFMRGLTVWPGYKNDKVEITRGERLSGATNYNLVKAVANAADGFVSFSVAPLRLATFLGLASAGFAVLVVIAHLLLWYFDRSIFGAGWLSIFLTIVFIGGLNLFCIGIVGEYVGRAFVELQKRPLYIVDYEVGFETAAVAADEDVQSLKIIRNR